jgi:hypothetical protein
MLKLNENKISLFLIIIAMLLLIVSSGNCEAKYKFNIPVETGQIVSIFDLPPEIDFVEGVPIFPSIRPVIVLRGSDYEMGYQYAQQVAQIFGPWLLEIVQRQFNDEEVKALKGYQWYIKEYTPEMIDFFKGMAAGSTYLGVPLSYQEVLAQFTLGVDPDGWGEYMFPPADQPGYPEGGQDTKLPPEDKCSSAAFWGSATKDGKMVTSGSSDGDDHFNVTLVVYPDDGNAYIHSPYYAVGPWVVAGGHSGMNEKGVVYVQHGCTMDAKTMGVDIRYGLQSDLAIRHTLRYANTAKEAVDLTLSYSCTHSPFAGGFYGTGGFWVDADGNAFVIERPLDPVVIRKPGDIGEVDFMYSTNTLLSPELKQEKKSYVEHAGWIPEGRLPCRDSSGSRNLFIWNFFNAYRGEMDLDFMKMAWRFRGHDVPVESTPDAFSDKAKADYDEGGCNWWKTIGQVTNAVVDITVPEDRLFFVSTTYPAQQPNISNPSSIHGQRWLPYATRTFYRLELTPTATGLMEAARYQAEIDLFFAQRELARVGYSHPGYTALDELYNQAIIEWTKGDFWQASISVGTTLAPTASEGEEIYYLAKATRAFVRCQSLARQVYDALVPPPTTPEDLGLKPFKMQW